MIRTLSNVALAAAVASLAATALVAQAGSGRGNATMPKYDKTTEITVTRGEDVLELRDETGRPLWAGQQRSRTRG